MKIQNINSFKVARTIIVLALFIIIGFTGCRHKTDPRLVQADSLMEEHPDSALIILESFNLSEKATAYDSALYGMLLSHARYKNFIDETDDSLISKSADFFIRAGIDSIAARALFLLGMIQMNSGRLGDAAVSFNKGLDLSRESKSYMWEGQCARGLYLIYGSLMNGSEQIRFSTESYEAFKKGNIQDWTDYSKLDIARAYHNNGQYKKSLQISEEIQMAAVQKKDSLLLGESYQLKGLSLFCLGNHVESIKNYASAYQINRQLLTNNDKSNIFCSLNNLTIVNIFDSIKYLHNIVNEIKKPIDAFSMLAERGEYEEAYKSLEEYKNIQDSVISLILKNDVSESMSHYNSMKRLIEVQKKRNERMLYWIIILTLVALGLIAVWRYRERLHMEKTMHLKAMADMESLRSDFMAQMEKTSNNPQCKIMSQFKEIDETYIRIIRQRYAEVNELCDASYQRRLVKNGKQQIIDKIDEIVGKFTDKSNLQDVTEYVDANSAGMYSSFRKEFFDLNEENRRLFLYLCLGFTARTISVFLNQDISAIYTKKSRLKSKITKSCTSRKEDFLKVF